jgi:hypothetical protein
MLENANNQTSDPQGGEGMGDGSEARRGGDVERQGMGRKGREWKGCVTLIFFLK